MWYDSSPDPVRWFEKGLVVDTTMDRDIEVFYGPKLDQRRATSYSFSLPPLVRNTLLVEASGYPEAVKAIRTGLEGCAAYCDREFPFLMRAAPWENGSRVVDGIALPTESEWYYTSELWREQDRCANVASCNELQRRANASLNYGADPDNAERFFLSNDRVSVHVLPAEGWHVERFAWDNAPPGFTPVDLDYAERVPSDAQHTDAPCDAMSGTVIFDLPDAGPNWYLRVEMAPDDLTELRAMSSDPSLGRAFILEDSMDVGYPKPVYGCPSGYTSKIFEAGEQVKLLAVPRYCEVFSHWEDARGDVLSTEPEFLYTVPSTGGSYKSVEKSSMGIGTAIIEAVMVGQTDNGPRITEIDFITDHDPMYETGVDDAGVLTFKDVGNPFPTIEWEARSNKDGGYPFIATKGSPCKIKVKVTGLDTSQYDKFILDGTWMLSATSSTAKNISFKGEVSPDSNGNGEVTLTGDSSYPNRIVSLQGIISWTMEVYKNGQFDGLNLNSTGAGFGVGYGHKVYLTFGKSNCDSSIYPEDQNENTICYITRKRMEHIMNAAQSASPSSPNYISRIAYNIAEANARLRQNTSPPNLHLWTALDPGGVLECQSAKLLTAVCLQMLGVNGNSLKWTCEDGCFSFPSTDITKPAPPVSIPHSYCSDCRYPEYTPNYLTNPFGTHEITYPCYIDKALYALHPNNFWLRLELIQGSTSSDYGAGENFLRIREDNGDWWYLPCWPVSGPYLGGDPDTDLDMMGRYDIMTFSRRWVWKGDPVLPAGTITTYSIPPFSCP